MSQQSHRNFCRQNWRLNGIFALAGLAGKRAQSDIKVTTSSKLVAKSVDANRSRIRHKNDSAGRSNFAVCQIRQTGFARPTVSH